MEERGQKCAPPRTQAGAGSEDDRPSDPSIALWLMKIFFDTNVYVAEALLGGMAEDLVRATERAGWRILCSDYILDELQRVLTESLGFSARLGTLSCRRIRHKARFVKPGASRHEVINDAKDGPVLKGALAAGAD